MGKLLPMNVTSAFKRPAPSSGARNKRHGSSKGATLLTSWPIVSRPQRPAGIPEPEKRTKMKYITNNDQRPARPGYYRVIYSDGQHGVEYFDGVTWNVEYHCPVDRWQDQFNDIALIIERHANG